VSAVTLAPPSLFDAVGGEPTLDELLAGLWEGLTAHDAVRCPVCQDRMEPEYGAGRMPAVGRCKRCGSTIT
jgi:hypothetical protein